MGKQLKRLGLFALVLVLAGACGDDKKSPSNATATTTNSTDALLAPKAAAITDLMAKNDWPGVRKDFDKTMLAGVDEKTLAEVWKQATDQYGGYKSRGEPKRYEDVSPTVVAFETLLTFERGTAKTRIAFNPDGTVAGLFLLPPGAP